MRILTVAIEKGGTGKTAVAVNLAAVLAEHGRRVLLVDLDPQGNATAWTTQDPQEAGNLLPILLGEGGPSTGLPGPKTTIPGVTLAPGGSGLVQVTAVEAPEAGDRLKRALNVIRGFDYAVLDCPPGLGVLSLAGILAADVVIAPTGSGPHDVMGLQRTAETVKLIRPGLQVRPVLSMLRRPLTRLARNIEQTLRKAYGRAMFRAMIPLTVRVSEAALHHRAVSPSNPAGKAYRSIAAEIRKGA